MFLGNLSSSMCGATCDSDVTLAAIMGIISYLQMRAGCQGDWDSPSWDDKAGLAAQYNTS